MKKQILKLVSFTAMLAVAVMPLTSCSDEEEPISLGFTSVETADGYTRISGEITGNEILVNEEGRKYLITGPVVVKDGGSLTVDPNGAPMTIEAEAKFAAYVLVAQGGKMYVRGTADNYVKFTSKNNDGKWGGLIINGYAPISGSKDSGNTAGAEVAAKYIYGGTDAADNSGSYEYLWLDMTGAKSSASVEHNGITLNGVGNGTKIENLYITETSDDGVEFFGGSVNVTNLLVVDSDDDMFDFTQGYTGTLSNAYGVWTAGYTSTEGDPRGVEADGNFDGLATDTDKNQSNFKIAGMTIEVNANPAADDDKTKMHDVIKLRRGATAEITNALVKGSCSKVADLIDLTDGKGDAVTTSSISLTNSLTSENTGTEINIAEGKTYSNVSVGGSNTGASTAAFTWTGYSF